MPQLLGDESEEEDRRWNVNLTAADVTASLREDFQLTVADSDALLDEGSVHHTALKEANAFFLSRGFVSLPQALVNGVQLDLDDVSPSP